MEEISFEDFTRVEIRTGTILDATLNTKARQPAYTLTIDFGPLGIKTSSAQRRRLTCGMIDFFSRF